MKYFTLNEFTRSTLAIKMGHKNDPPAEHRRNICEFVDNLLDPLRKAWALYCHEKKLGTPMLQITSGYRSWALNAAVGGSATSAHCIGYAADIVPMNNKLAEFKDFCKSWLQDKDFDQLISEDEDDNGIPQWLHIGYKNRQSEQRKQMLSKECGKNTYTSITT